MNGVNLPQKYQLNRLRTLKIEKGKPFLIDGEWYVYHVCNGCLACLGQANLACPVTGVYFLGPRKTYQAETFAFDNFSRDIGLSDFCQLTEFLPKLIEEMSPETWQQRMVLTLFGSQLNKTTEQLKILYSMYHAILLTSAPLQQELQNAIERWASEQTGAKGRFHYH